MQPDITLSPLPAPSSLAERLRAAIERYGAEHGLSKSRVVGACAHEADVSAMAIQSWLSGKTIPRRPHQRALEEFFGPYWPAA